jgi:hypothetical protein
MQSVPVNTNDVSSNPAHDELYSIQYYVIKFVSDLRQVGGFLLSILVFWNIDESDVKHHNPPSHLNTQITYRNSTWSLCRCLGLESSFNLGLQVPCGDGVNEITEGRPTLYKCNAL